MKQRFPQVTEWKEPVELYPEGKWLVDPKLFGDYVHLIDGNAEALDLIALNPELAFQRLHSWLEHGKLPHLSDLSFMQDKVQRLPNSVSIEKGKMGGLDILRAHTQGFRSQYQDRMALFSLPMDRSSLGGYVMALFDGHGPQIGGESVAELLSSSEALDVMIKAMQEWSERIKNSWLFMQEGDIENGWQFVLLHLQQLIRRKLVENIHSSHIALQASSLAVTLGQTLKSLTLITRASSNQLQPTIERLALLGEQLNSYCSLEGIGSTAVYTFLYPDPERDRIDFWIINVGDSWSGLVMREGPHYSLVDEAIPGKPHFDREIRARGGWIKEDKYGMLRLGGEYNLCRGLGDLYVIREWAEVKACVQICGMSPRGSISRGTFCADPSELGEIGFDQVMAIVQHCDGMKESGTLESDQICSYLATVMEEEEGDERLLEASKRLVERAVEGGSNDNCTLQLIDLRSLASFEKRQHFYQQLRPSSSSL